MTEKPFAFVLMPFSSEHDDTYNLGIKSTVEAAGMIAQRVDEQVFHREGILQRIYNQIEAADLIIADMTGRNANVFYEVGYSHAKAKLCILLTKSAQDIPFDLKHHRHIVYSSIGDLQAKLAADLNAVRSNELAARENPVSVELKSASGILEKTKWSATADTTLILDLHNRTPNMSPDIDAIYLYTGPGWTYKQDQNECPSAPSDIQGANGLRHFLRSPLPRLARGGWAQIRLDGNKLLASTHRGQVLEDKYKLAGHIRVRISTAKGNLDSILNLALEIEEFPF
jgi:hypothetical protein